MTTKKYGRTTSGDNVKVNELLYRRADIEDVCQRPPARNPESVHHRLWPIHYQRNHISATTPFTHDDLQGLRTDTPTVVRRCVPCYEDEYGRRGWSMVPTIDRVYVNELARAQLRMATTLRLRLRHPAPPCLRRLSELLGTSGGLQGIPCRIVCRGPVSDRLNWQVGDSRGPAPRVFLLRPA
jgi:hypothetical protein